MNKHEYIEPTVSLNCFFLSKRKMQHTIKIEYLYIHCTLRLVLVE